MKLFKVTLGKLDSTRDYYVVANGYDAAACAAAGAASIDNGRPALVDSVVEVAEDGYLILPPAKPVSDIPDNWPPAQLDDNVVIDLPNRPLHGKWGRVIKVDAVTGHSVWIHNTRDVAILFPKYLMTKEEWLFRQHVATGLVDAKSQQSVAA